MHVQSNLGPQVLLPVCKWSRRSWHSCTIKMIFFREQFQLSLHFTNTNMQTLECSTFVRPSGGNSFLVQWGDSVGVYRNLLKGCVSLNSLWNCSWSTSDISGSGKTIIMSTQLWLFMRNPYELDTNWIWCIFFSPVNALPYQQCSPSVCVCVFFPCPSGLMFS